MPIALALTGYPTVITATPSATDAKAPGLAHQAWRASRCNKRPPYVGSVPVCAVRNATPRRQRARRGVDWRRRLGRGWRGLASPPLRSEDAMGRAFHRPIRVLPWQDNYRSEHAEVVVEQATVVIGPRLIKG